MDRDDSHQLEGRGEVAQTAAGLLRRRWKADEGADGRPKPAAAPSGGGGRGRRGGGRVKENIIENKKDDMVEYMGQASALIQKTFLPTPR